MNTARLAAAKSDASRAAKTMARQTPQAQPQPPAAMGLTVPVGIACACGGGCPRCTGVVQAKLVVGSATDPLEQEADRAAEQVMSGPVPSTLRHAPLRIQRKASAAAGAAPAPQSVDRALQGQGRSLPAAVQGEMSQRLGHDFSQVRVHTGSLAEASAKDVQAKAYTVGSNIVFGAGHYAPESRQGRQLLAHELTHVVQQSGAGDAYVARSVDDWLTGSVNISSMTYTQLLAEVDELTQYLDRQTSSSPETIRIEEAIRSLRAEVNRRDAAAAGPRARGRAATRPTASTAPLPARYPRILIEMTSVAYANPEEMREEYDLIMQWLARTELSASERRTLTAERDSLAPQLRTDRERVMAERHSARIRTALTSDDEDQSRALETLARTIQGITPDPARSSVSYLYHQGERIAIGREQAAQLRANLATELGRAVRGIDGRAQYYWDRYNSQLSINRDSPIIAGISGWLGGVEDPDDELRSRYFWSYHRLRRIENELRADRLVEAAAMLARVEFVGQEIRQLSRAFYEGHIEGAESAVTGLTFTRDASFAIAGSIAAVVAAPVVAGVVGAGGLGLTGTTAAIVTTGGTGLVVGTGTAVVRGGSDALGTAAAGGTADEVGRAFWSGARRGFREGFLTGGAGAAAQILGPALGVGSTLGAQALRRVAAEAIVNGTSAMIDVLVQGGSLDQAVRQGVQAAVLSAPGALIGGSNNPIARNLVAPLTAGGTAYLGARANGVPPGEAMASAAVAVVTNIGMTRAANPAGGSTALRDMGLEVRAEVGSVATSATRRVASVSAAVMIGTSAALPPLRSGYGGTSITMPADVSSTGGSAISSVSHVDTPDVVPARAVAPADAATTAPVAPVAAPDTAPTASTAPVAAPDTAATASTAPVAAPDVAPTASTAPVAAPDIAPTASTAPVAVPDAAPIASAAPVADTAVAPVAPVSAAADATPVAPVSAADTSTVAPVAHADPSAPTATPIADAEAMGSLLSQELGLAPQQDPTGTIATQIQGTHALAEAAGFATSQGDAAGPIDIIAGPHGHAPERRAATGQTGATRQSAHIGATGLLRTIANYSRNAALSVMMPRAQHRAFDRHWLGWAASRRGTLRAFGVTNPTAPLSDMLNAQRRAIQQTPGLSQQQRNTMEWMLAHEYQTFASQLPNGMATEVPLPGR